jgi:hypothetical protein
MWKIVAYLQFSENDIERGMRLKERSKKELFERPINRREGRKQSRAEYEEIEERRVRWRRIL